MNYKMQLEKKLSKQKLRFNNYFFLWMRGFSVLMLIIIVCEILSFFFNIAILGALLVEGFLMFIGVRAMFSAKKKVEKVRVKLKELENAK